MLQRCCKLSSRSVYPGFSASSPGQAATQRNPLHSLRVLPSSGETAIQAQTGDAYVTSEVLYQLSYVGLAGISRILRAPVAIWCSAGAAKSGLAAASAKRSRRSRRMTGLCVGLEQRPHATLS
jgi:hypothetical protein